VPCDDALARWAAAELRSTNAQIEYLLRQALHAEGACPPTPSGCAAPAAPAADGDDETNSRAVDAGRPWPPLA